MEKTLGFIGGGRLTGIFLGGLRKAGALSQKIMVSDVREEALERIKSSFPGIHAYLKDNSKPFSADYVFLAVPPPLVLQVTREGKENLKETAVVFSPAPGIRISQILEALSGFKRIVRVIPNAPSLICQGFNPLTFSEGFSGEEKNEIKS